MNGEDTKRTRAVEPSTWVGVALAVVAIAFVVQNRTTVTIQLFWLSLGAPMWLVLLLIFLVGWAVGALVRRRRARRSVRSGGRSPAALVPRSSPETRRAGGRHGSR